jgi:hypothetical protein
MKNQGVDIIGDIHGRADELEALLKKLGYREHSGCYRHPHRNALFLGDLIDRGNQNARVVRIVRDMVDHATMNTTPSVITLDIRKQASRFVNTLIKTRSSMLNFSQRLVSTATIVPISSTGFALCKFFRKQKHFAPSMPAGILPKSKALKIISKAIFLRMIFCCGPLTKLVMSTP